MKAHQSSDLTLMPTREASRQLFLAKFAARSLAGQLRSLYDEGLSLPHRERLGGPNTGTLVLTVWGQLLFNKFSARNAIPVGSLSVKDISTSVP